MATKLDDVENEVFNSGSGVGFDPVQPEESEKCTELRDRVKDVMYDAFLEKYGGERYTYERFLAARNNNIDKAEKMIKKAIEFRKQRNLDGEKSEEELEELDRIFKECEPHWFLKFWGYSKEGNLLTYASVKNVVLKDLLEIPEDHIKRFYLMMLDKAFTMQNYANTPPRKSSENSKWNGSIDVINLKGISMSHLHISGLRLLNRVLKIAQLVAPEIMDKTYIIHAPWFFSAAWAIIKNVLAPDIVAKVVITSGSAEKEILEHLGGDREQYEDLLNSFSS
uniref:CRAL-TRIO domain-containing protein n=1 Tax=Aplanochytrium stocchinoi TaxID=215587 RepID=A0A7S3PQP5_9STRA